MEDVMVVRRSVRGISASRVVAFMLALSNLGHAAVSRGPWLQLPTTHSMNIRWATLPAEICTVRWGLASTSEHAQVETAATTLHSMTLDGLQPGTAYRYEIVPPGGPSTGVYTFKTAPSSATGPLKIAVIGDSQDATATGYALQRLTAEQPDIILHNGDNCYSTIEDWSLSASRPVLAQAPLLVSVGNHDADGGINGKYNAWEGWFGIPAERPIAAKGDCYAFEYAGVKLFAYSNGYTYTSAYDQYWTDAMVDKFFTPYAVQATFFSDQLQQAQGHCRFIMMFGHRYLFGSDMAELSSVLQPDNPYRVDLITNGHDNSYESQFLSQYALWSFESAGLAGTPGHYVMVTLTTQGDSTRADVVAKRSQDGAVLAQWSFYSKQPAVSVSRGAVNRPASVMPHAAGDGSAMLFDVRGRVVTGRSVTAGVYVVRARKTARTECWSAGVLE